MTTDTTPASEPEFDEETVEGAAAAYTQIREDDARPMPEWDTLPPEMQRAFCHAWACGYDAALDMVEGESGEPVNGE